jgi:hypothetical protein
VRIDPAPPVRGHVGGCVDLALEDPGQSEEHSLRFRVQRPDVRESAPSQSEVQSTGPRTLTV